MADQFVVFPSQAGGGGSGITQLTGQVTAGPGSGSVVATVTNASVIAKVLTGFSAAAGVVAAADSILSAFNKVVGNITALRVQSCTGFVVAPTDTTYTLDLYTAFAGTINELKIITSSGTCTAAVAINGTPVTGISAVSVSGTIATGTASAANTFTAGQKLTLTISASAAPTNLAFTLKYTR